MKNYKNVNNELYELPYEKFVKKGSDALTDQELLSVLLQTGTRDKTVLQLAEDVLSGCRILAPGLCGLHKISLPELMKIDGVGRVKAIRLKAAVEIADRIWRTNTGSKLFFHKPESIADYYKESFRHETVEKVLVVLLNNRMGFIADKVLSTGTVNAALISPRDIFIEALKMQAVNMILVHNHPSGDTTPSRADIDITNRIYSFGREIDINLVDHIIIGDQNYYSFKERGMFPV